MLLALSCASAELVAAEMAGRQRLHQQVLAKTSAADVRAEIEFGRDIAARVLGRFALLKDERRNRYINLLGTALASQAGRPELNFYFAILDSDSVNAYSAPGGYIFITKGALSLAEDEAELAAILAHEIAHVTERHIVKALNIRADESGGMGRLLSAGTDTARVAFTQALDQALAILFESGYSQEDELAADHAATLLLAHSGFDAQALQRYLQRAEAAQTGTALNTTHPPSAQRLSALDRLIAEEELNGIDMARNKERFESYVKTP